jgi:hypothetical protein
VMLCSFVIEDPEDGGSKALWNVGFLPHHCMGHNLGDHDFNLHHHENLKFHSYRFYKISIVVVK